jgi:hypothetical protein
MQNRPFDRQMRPKIWLNANHKADKKKAQFAQLAKSPSL